MYLHITLADPFLNTIYIRVLCMQEARKNWHLGVPPVIRKSQDLQSFPMLFFFCPSDNFPVSLISCLSPHLSLCQWDVMVSPRWTPLPPLGLTLHISFLCWSLSVYFSSYFKVSIYLYSQMFLIARKYLSVILFVLTRVPCRQVLFRLPFFFFFFQAPLRQTGWYMTVAESSQCGFYVSTFNL